MEELKINVYDRYPSGTSKYSLVKKSLEILSDWSFSKLVPCDLDLDWLFEVCNDIETNQSNIIYGLKLKIYVRTPSTFQN